MKDAARLVGRHPSRIRKICLDNAIGESVQGRIRLLTGQDIELIRRFAVGRGFRPIFQNS